jgi:hypothetical protein
MAAEACFWKGAGVRDARDPRFRLPMNTKSGARTCETPVSTPSHIRASTLRFLQLFLRSNRT